MSVEEQLKNLREAIFDGELGEALEVSKQVVESQVDVTSIFKEAIIPAINDIGDSMAEGDFFMPEVKISAKVLNEMIGILQPYVLAQQGLAEIAIPPWTGEGDIDDIGEYLMNAVAGIQDQPVADLAGFFIMIARGLDTHEFTPCKIQGKEVADK